MLFISEKRRKEYRDVILIFLYFGIMFMLFSSIIVNTLFFFEVFITSILFLIISIGMNFIILYYYLNKKTKKPKIILERALIIHILTCSIILSSILYISIGIKLKLF